MRREAHEEDVRIAEQTRREIRIAHGAAAGNVVCGVDEAAPRIDLIAEGELVPVQGLLEVGGLEAGLDREFAAYRLGVGIDAADGGGVQCSLAGLVAGDEEPEAPHDATHVLVITGAGGDEGAGERGPLVAVVQRYTGAARRA